MTTTSQRFTTFISNLQLTDAQLTDAITKHTGVRKTLHNAYYSTQFIKSISETELQTVISETVKSYKANDALIDDSPQYRTSLLVGSYGKNTEIAPPSDIDILFEMPSDQFNRYDSYKGNGQSQLLQDVKDILQKTYSRTAIRADGQIVYVPFESYKIEVLPAFRLQDTSYYYPDTHDGGSWHRTHPRAEKRNLADSNRRSNGNTIRLIKMIKAWKQYCSVPIKSLGIELVAVDFLSQWEHYNKTAVYYDWMVRDFLDYLVKHANWSYYIPGISETLSLGDEWKTKAESALSRSQKACEYESLDQGLNATIEWQKIFGMRI